MKFIDPGENVHSFSLLPAIHRPCLFPFVHLCKDQGVIDGTANRITINSCVKFSKSLCISRWCVPSNFLSVSSHLTWPSILNRQSSKYCCLVGRSWLHILLSLFYLAPYKCSDPFKWWIRSRRQGWGSFPDDVFQKEIAFQFTTTAKVPRLNTWNIASLLFCKVSPLHFSRGSRLLCKKGIHEGSCMWNLHLRASETQMSLKEGGHVNCLDVQRVAFSAS